MKKMVIILFLTGLMMQISFAETVKTNQTTISTNQWNVVIYPFENKTDKNREETLKLVIQNSIKTFLSRVSYLNVVNVNNETGNMRDVFRQAYTNGYDIAVTGSYVLIGEKIFIFVKVYDILQKQLKFENTYSGNAGSDIFDTLDEIIENLKQDVTKAVKPIDDETLIKYRKRVELVSGEMNLDRSFVTTLGLNDSFTYKNTAIPFLALEMRLANFMFGISMFMPIFSGNSETGNLSDNSILEWKNTFLFAYAGYRFFDTLTIGVGTMPFFMVVGEPRYTNSTSSSSAFSSPSFFGFMAFVKYDVNPSFSIKGSFTMNSISDTFGGNYNYSIPIPTFGLGIDYYFLENWGVKMEFYYGETTSNTAINGTDYSFGNTILLLGVNYRVDLK